MTVGYVFSYVFGRREFVPSLSTPGVVGLGRRRRIVRGVGVLSIVVVRNTMTIFVPTEFSLAVRQWRVM